MKVMVAPPFGIIVRALLMGLMVDQPLGVMVVVGHMVPKGVLLTGVMVLERLTGLMEVQLLGAMVRVLRMALMVGQHLGIMALELQPVLMAALFLGTGKLIDFVALIGNLCSTAT
jgi:hypothetical protein